MAEIREGLLALNAGEVSKTALAHVDLAKLKIACEREENFLPLVLGPAMMRPGTQFIARGWGDQQAYLFEFKKDETAAALLCAFTDGTLLVLDAATDSFITRPAVSAVVLNGDFTADLSNWTDNSEIGASIHWTGGAGGYLALVGTGFNYAYADQQIVVTEIHVEHALHIKIFRGNVVVKIGTNDGTAEYWDVELAEGEYSLAFYPVGNVFIRLGSRTTWAAYVDSVEVEAAGFMKLSHPWYSSVFDKIQYDRSEDVIFVACEGFQQRRIERRNDLDMRSWGIAQYRVDDGPFRVANLGSTALLPDAVTGSIHVNSSRPFFHPGHLGALFRLTHAFQTQQTILAGGNQFCPPIRVTGIEPGREFTFHITGRTASTITLQKSFSDPGSWSDVQTYAADGTYTYDDTLDNQIYWYRLGITTPNYAGPDVVTVKMEHSGSQTGIVRVTNVTHSQSVTADVLTTLGAAGVTTTDWSESEWSEFRGWPHAVALHDGRLFWQCALRCQGSISDAFHSYDDTFLGDAGPINRTTVNSKPHWMASTLRLLIGSTLQEISVRASAFDEPLTATAFAPRACSDRGSMQMRAVAVDGRVVFVGRDRRRVFLLEYDAAKTDFVAKEVTRLKQEMCESLVVDVAAQRQPDTRVYMVLGNGDIAVLVHEPNEDVSALVPFTFDGSVERVACLPGIEEDKVYIYVTRGDQRCIERFAMRSEAKGGLLNKCMDSHILYSGPPTTTIAMPSHLEGARCVAWADGQPLITQAAPIFPSGGIATLPVLVQNAVIGLPYNASLQTAKLAFAAKSGTSLSAAKRVGRISLVMSDVGWKGVKIGRDFNHMQALPATYHGRPLNATEVVGEWDAIPAAWNGGWGSDPRVCITVASPYCATLMGIALGEQVNEGEDAPAPREPG